MNINHLHLKVASVEGARTFYATYFGLKDHVWHDDILFMRDEAGMDLALAPAEAADPLPAWFHFGFRLESGEAVERLHSQVAEAGAVTHPLEKEDDVVFFRCADPDGHAIEVYWEP